MKRQSIVLSSLILLAACGSSSMSGQQSEIEKKVLSIYSSQPNIDDRSRDGTQKMNEWRTLHAAFTKSFLNIKAENWKCTAKDASDAASQLKKYPQNDTGIIKCFGIVDGIYSRNKIDMEMPRDMAINLGDIFQGDKFELSGSISYFSDAVASGKADFTTTIQVSKIKIVK